MHTLPSVLSFLTQGPEKAWCIHPEAQQSKSSMGIGTIHSTCDGHPAQRCKTGQHSTILSYLSRMTSESWWLHTHNPRLQSAVLEQRLTMASSTDIDAYILVE